jgi:HAD superfamily hydrolase (TIGR01484 family)
LSIISGRTPAPSHGFAALACDYDATLAHEGRVAAATVEALDRLAARGWRLVLVTGRELADLRRVFPEVERFDSVVAENGALLVQPATGDEAVLGQPPEPAMLEALRARGVTPISVGRSIVATREPYEPVAREIIHTLGVRRQVILNKGGVMLLPDGVDKASGLAQALRQLALPAARTIGVGDAENDRTFLRLCGYSVAVRNALPELLAEADLVTEGEDGAGVVELIERLLSDALPDRRHARA